LASLQAIGCGDDTTAPQTGSIYVRLVMFGTQPDADGCRVSVDGGAGTLLLDGEDHVFEGLPTGTHVVTISDVAFNCSVEGDVSQAVVVRADETAPASFVVDCPAPGGIEVATATAGSTADPDGYTVVLDGVTTRAIGVDGHETFADLTVGQHEVELLDVADNCSVAGENPRSVTVQDGVTTRVDLTVACPPFYDYIAFSGGGLSVMRPDGSERVKLTDIRGTPAWAPDATRIATSGSGGIWVLNTATMHLTQLTLTDGGGYPSWSPDGTRIAYHHFDCVDCDTCGDIWVINADGTDPMNLTPGPARGLEPAWSPDGSRIVFTREVDGIREVFVMQADGSNPVRLTDLRASMPGSRYRPVAFDPAWSPDGARIAFSGPGEQADNTIWVMDDDGSNVTQVTADLPAYQAWRPSWSPDGTRIAYWVYRPDDGYSYQIYVMEADGSNPVNITNGEGVNTNPAWSPAR
jgi:Tol biopolymer transport system component